MLPPKWVIDGAKRLLIEGIFVSIPVIMAASFLFPDEARFHRVITKIAPLFFIYSSFKAGIIKSFQGICLLVSVTAFICLGIYRSKKMTGEPIPVAKPGSLDRIVGHKEAKTILRRFVTMVRNPQLTKRLGVESSNHLLLYGPPGTGKTELARAIADETGFGFWEISAASFMEVYMGSGAKNVKEAFAVARTLARRNKVPTILFIDEIDCLGRRESSSHSVLSSGENNKTIAELLVQMSSTENKGKVYCIAATNNHRQIDQALLRSGRFGNWAACNPPENKGERLQILKGQKSAECFTDRALGDIAATVGYTGATLVSLLNEAAQEVLGQCVEKIERGETVVLKTPECDQCLNEVFRAYYQARS